MNDQTQQNVHHSEESLLLQQGTSGSGASLWQIIRDRLCGRWLQAITLGIAMGLALGFVGYRTAEKTYTSVGIIRVAPNISPIMRQTIETGIMPLYSNFVQTQAALLSAQRVLGRAVDSLPMDELPWPSRSEAIRGLQDTMTTEAPRGSELIVVKVDAQSPELAQRLVNAVITAYDDRYASAGGEDVTRKLQTLRAHRDMLRAQQRQKRDQLRAALDSAEFAVADFRELIMEKAKRIEQNEAELRRLAGSIELTRESNSTADESESGERIDPRQLEAFDQELARLGRLREQAQLELQRAAQRYAPSHLLYRNAEEELGIVQRRYDEHAAAVLEDYHDSGQAPMLDAASQIRHRMAQLEVQLETDRAAARAMSDVQFEIDDLQGELENVEQDLAQATERIGELEMESDAIRSGRITIESRGELPASPSQDRRLALAVIGALGGMGASLGLFFMIGTLDRRAFVASQLDETDTSGRLLGVLPRLPRGDSTLEESGIAAHCVHQVRNHIEAIRPRDRAAVLAVSSPYQGDGKTSLTMALGASYAVSGSRTLIVDGDLVSGNLSRQLLQTQATGLREALTSQHINGSVKTITTHNLSIMPCGVLPEFGPERIHRSDLIKLFDALRARFDIVLVDTGPLFGSIEGLPIAAAADGVILTLKRGRRQAQLKACIDALHRVKAHYLGVVLNHARSSDCDRYVSPSVRSAPAAALEGKQITGSTRGEPRNALMSAMHLSAAGTGDKHDR